MSTRLTQQERKALRHRQRGEWEYDHEGNCQAVEAIIAAHEAEVEQRFVKWLVEVVYYPIDMLFEEAAPVNHDLIAEHWRIWDNWYDVTPEEARATIRDEAGQ